MRSTDLGDVLTRLAGKGATSNIYDANIESNGGTLKSDLDGTELVTPHKSLSGVTPSQNEAQIDHITSRNPSDPNATSRTNSYSNAQVLSRAQNRAKLNN